SCSLSFVYSSLMKLHPFKYSFFFQAEDGIRDRNVTGVQTCALPISYLNSTELKSHFETFEDGQERDMNIRRHIKTMLDASIKSYINLSGAKRDAKLGDLKNEVSLNKWGAVFRNRRDEWTNKAVFETLKKRLTQAIVSLKEQSLPEQVREERYLQGVARILTEELGDDMFVVLTQMLEPTDEVAELATQIPKVVERTFNQLKNQIIQLYQETE